MFEALLTMSPVQSFRSVMHHPYFVLYCLRKKNLEIHRGTDVGQGVATVMNGPVENMAESNGLNVQVQTQAATIRTLRTLLEQYRQENEQLHTVASVGGPVEAHVPVSKENAPEPNHLLLRGHDMERKLRETESLAMKLAIQVLT